MEHEERAQLARDIVARVVTGHPDDIVLAGVYGSVATGTDTAWSDLELLLVVRDGSRLRQQEFLFRDTPVGIYVHEQGKLERTLTGPTADWPFLMGVLSVLQVLRGDPEQLRSWLRMGEAVPPERFEAALEKLLPGLVTESHGRIHSCIERGLPEDIGCAALEVLFEMRDALCLLNRRWVTHDYYQGLVETFGFPKLPQRYRELVPALWSARDPQETARLADELVTSFRKLLVDEGVRVGNYTRIDDLPL